MYSHKLNTQIFLQSLKLLCASAPLLLPAACGAQNDQPVSSDKPAATSAPMSDTRVYGTVTDMNGRPLAEVGIAVTSGTAPYREILMLSGEDGNYIWSLPPGKFTLNASKDGYRSQSREVEVKDKEATRLDFKLETLP